MTEQEQNRRDKLADLAQSMNAYPDRYQTTHALQAARALPDGTAAVRVAGRILSIRRMGRLSFVVIGDVEGRLQLALKEDRLGPEAYAFFSDHLDLGDFLGAEGEMFTTRTGEKTLQAGICTFLGKCLKVLPEKWHGLSDIEACYRHRYLDLIMSEETRTRFLLKTRLMSGFRRFLENAGFLEAETPVFQNKPSGALATPFLSHHQALDLDVYLRIAPETYLKRLVVGGFTKVFEFARCFRNEGMSPVHLQDFTMLECYAAYWNYRDNMDFVREMILSVYRGATGTTVLALGDETVDLAEEWPVVSFRELILQDAGLDIDVFSTAADLLAAIRTNGIRLEHENLETLELGNLIDLLYKKVSRPKLRRPTFLVEHPIALSPLARANDENPRITDRFQLVVQGAEIVNAYSELVDPEEQRRRLEIQAAGRERGDGEAMMLDEDYLDAMAYGMPPISGWGMGIERFVQVVTGAANIRDCVLFPLMRPLE